MAANVTSKELERLKSAPAPAPAPAPVDMRRAFRRIKHRQRGKLAFVRPVAWLAAIQTTGVLAHETGLGLMVTAPAAAVVMATIAVRAKRRGQKARMARPASGSLWLLVAVFLGPYGLVAFVLWIVGLGGAVNYWFAAYKGLTRSNRKALPKMDMPKADALAGLPRWYAETVAPAHPVFVDTHLTDAEPVPGGFTAVIVGVPGKTQTGLMEKQIGVIASARGVPMDQVEMGPPPGRSYSGARITIIERGDNLRQVRYLEDDAAAIDVKTGIARVGYFFDLKPAHWSFWTTSAGAQMGINSGSTGAGKSAFGGAKLALVHQCPVAVSVLLDAQDGSSQPDWNGRTEIGREGVQACWEELQMSDYVMLRRAHHIAHAPWVDELGRERHGKPFLLPGDPDLGGMVLMYFMFEELSLLLQDDEVGAEATTLLATAVKTWRKAGGSVDAYLQNLGLENFGGKTISNTLRSNLAAGGSVAAFRNGSSVDHGMVGLKGNPSTLEEFWDGTTEKTHGLGFMKGIDNRPGGKWRASISRDLYGIATSPAAAQLDPITAGFREEYRDLVRRGIDPRDEHAPTPAKAAAKTAKAEKPKWSSGDVEAVVEHALLSGPKELGAICVAARRRLGGMPLGEVPAALRALQVSDRVRKTGDTFRLNTEGSN